MKAKLEEIINAINNVILEEKKEKLKTKELKLQAKIHIEKVKNKTEKQLIKLKKEDDENKKLYEEKIRELSNEKFRNNYKKINILIK